MTPYWVLFGMWAAGAVQYPRDRANALGRALFVAAATATALMIGLRYSVGGDWGAYERIYHEILFLPLGSALEQTDPGYAFLNWVASRNDWGVWFGNLVCGAMFTAGLARLAARQPNPWLAVLVAVPYLVIVVAMGYTRQAAAIGIICWAIADAAPGRVLRLVILIGIAALFHKTAILFLPILLAPIATRNPLVAAAGAVVFAMLATALLGGASDTLITNYVNSDYDSQGAFIRVAMNVVAASILLVFRRRMDFNDYGGRLWVICSALALVSAVALRLSSASSGVDRLALFLIPLQVVAFSRLPYALSPSRRALPSVLLAVIGYGFAVQFVWLNYADNANYWLPYRTVLASDAQ